MSKTLSLKLESSTWRNLGTRGVGTRDRTRAGILIAKFEPALH